MGEEVENGKNKREGQMMFGWGLKVRGKEASLNKAYSVAQLLKKMFAQT